jgi:hypothetical protein
MSPLRLRSRCRTLTHARAEARQGSAPQTPAILVLARSAHLERERRTARLVVTSASAAPWAAVQARSVRGHERHPRRFRVRPSSERERRDGTGWPGHAVTLHRYLAIMHALHCALLPATSLHRRIDLNDRRPACG